MANRFDKDPASVLDYQWDWSDWLPTDDTITSATVTADTGLTVDSSSTTTTTVTAWLSGGTAGTTYAVTCQIVTADERTDERTIRISVKDR
jgi:hypothetical protein